MTPHSVTQDASPPLLRGLAGGAESAGNVTPAAAEDAEAIDGVPGGGVEFVGQVEEVGQGFDVAFGDPSAVGADDTDGEAGVAQVLHLGSAAPGPAAHGLA
jgi:hypothetical protein